MRKTTNDDGFIQLTLILLLAIVLCIVAFGAFFFVAFSTKALISVALVGMGLFLFYRPMSLQGNVRYYIPIGLLFLGILFYVGTFDRFLG